VLHREPVNAASLDEICAKIDTQARRAGQVMDNVRKFIRRQEDRSEPLDVNDVVEDVRDLMEADAHAAGVPIALRHTEDLPLVRADAIQLQQVLLNLTRNAVDAMREGPEKRRGILVATDRTLGGGVRVSVTDHGPGVSKSLGENIFHPFVTTKSNGLGVGLAISRTIVQGLGGTLDFDDNPNGGAVFSVELPPAAREGEGQ
jgi:two-component system sensor histidine kinase DctS